MARKKKHRLRRWTIGLLCVLLFVFCGGWLLRTWFPLSYSAEVEAAAEKYGLAYIPYFDGKIKRFNHKDATKAIGNRALMKILGSSVDEAITFGDDNGDLGMILESGHGVIMKNAAEKLRSRAKYVTDYPNTEDGVARYLEKLFLGKK